MLACPMYPVVMVILLSLSFSGVQLALAAKNNTINNNFSNLVGDTLFKWSNDGLQLQLGKTSDLLKGKNAVGIYFSASWCGPCRQFTPVLVDYYKEVNKRGKKFEVVLVSQDQSDDDFINYYSKMPWLAIPIDSVTEYVQSLGAKYRLKGIPHLVILDGYDASLITLDGRGKVMGDKYGLEYPYRTRSIANAIPRPIRNIIRGAANKVKSGLKGLVVGAGQAAKSGLRVMALQLQAVVVKALDSILPASIMGLFKRKGK